MAKDTNGVAAKWRYRQVAAHLGLPVSTVRCLVFRKEIPHHRVGPRTVLFDPMEVEAWFSQRLVVPSASSLEKSA